MAFPTLADADTTKSTGSGTSAVVDLPTTVDAGDLLVILIATDGDNTFGWTNFTEIDEGDDGKDIALACAYKVAVGDEDGGTETVTLGTNERWAACCYRITTGTHGGSSDPPEASTIATGEDAAANPTTCTPTGGAKDYLWITFMGLDNNSSSGSSAPSGYSDMEYQDSGTPGMCSIATSYRTNNAASEDAGAWTNSDDDWCAYTIAIHPASADRRALISAAEFETEDAARKAYVSAAEFETEDAARKAYVSAAEFETEDAARKAYISAAEFETEDEFVDRRALISAAEFETEDAARRAYVSAAEFETEDAARRALVSAAEFELEDAARRALVSAAELELEDAARRAYVSAAEFEVPEYNRRALVSAAELQVPNEPGVVEIDHSSMAIEIGIAI